MDALKVQLVDGEGNIVASFLTSALRPYESGSEGYNLTGKIALPYGDDTAEFQVSGNLIRVDSQYEGDASVKRSAAASAARLAKEKAREEKRARRTAAGATVFTPAPRTQNTQADKDAMRERLRSNPNSAASAR